MIKTMYQLAYAIFISLSLNFINLVVTFYFADLVKGKEREKNVNGVEDEKHYQHLYVSEYCCCYYHYYYYHYYYYYY